MTTIPGTTGTLRPQPRPRPRPRTEPTTTLTLTAAQWQVLRTLQHQYRQDCDLFGRHERAHLHFMRWLYQTGRLVP